MPSRPISSSVMSMSPCYWYVFNTRFPLLRSQTWPHTVKLGKDGGNQMLWAFHSIRSGWPTYRVHRRLLQSPTVPFEHRLPNASSSKNGHNHGSSCINQECSGPASGTIATSVASFMAASSTALLYRSWSVCPLVSTHFLADHVVYLIGENSNIAIGDVRKSRCKTNKIV